MGCQVEPSNSTNLVNQPYLSTGEETKPAHMDRLFLELHVALGFHLDLKRLMH